MKKYVYLILAVLGLIGTWYFNIQYTLATEGGNFFQFFADAAINDAGRSISIDIAVVCIVFFVWYIPEARRLKMKGWWVFIPVTFLIALAFAFPLFMFFRERKMEQIAVEN